MHYVLPRCVAETTPSGPTASGRRTRCKSFGRGSGPCGYSGLAKRRFASRHRRAGCRREPDPGGGSTYYHFLVPHLSTATCGSSEDRKISVDSPPGLRPTSGCWKSTEGRRPTPRGTTAASTHHLTPGRRARLVADRGGAAVFDRHHRPLEAAVRERRQWKLRKIGELLRDLPQDEAAVFQDEVDLNLTPTWGACGCARANRPGWSRPAPT